MLTKIIDNSLIESILKDLKYHIIYYFDSLKCGNSNIQLDQDNINEAFYLMKISVCIFIEMMV